MLYLKEIHKVQLDVDAARARKPQRILPEKLSLNKVKLLLTKTEKKHTQNHIDHYLRIEFSQCRID